MSSHSHIVVVFIAVFVVVVVVVVVSILSYLNCNTHPGGIECIKHFLQVHTSIVAGCRDDYSFLKLSLRHKIISSQSTYTQIL